MANEIVWFDGKETERFFIKNNEDKFYSFELKNFVNDKNFATPFGSIEGAEMAIDAAGLKDVVTVIHKPLFDIKTKKYYYA